MYNWPFFFTWNTMLLKPRFPFLHFQLLFILSIAKHTSHNQINIICPRIPSLHTLKRTQIIQLQLINLILFQQIITIKQKVITFNKPNSSIYIGIELCLHVDAVKSLLDEFVIVFFLLF